MSSMKFIPEGLKLVECKHGMGGKNPPTHYIPKQNPVQDALEKTKKTTYFKLTLPNTGNELILSSFYCMYTLTYMCASRLGLTQPMPMPQWH